MEFNFHLIYQDESILELYLAAFEIFYGSCVCFSVCQQLILEMQNS